MNGNMKQEKKIKLSLVIPVKDEEDSIISLAKEIETVMVQSPYLWECIWIDDGSKDHTPDLLKEMKNKNAFHEYIRLTQNFGQSAAMMTGFQYARGDYIITLDGDGQNEPSDIPDMVSFCIEHDADIVNGYRLVREDSWVRIISSRVANFIRNKITQDFIRDVGCSMRIIRRKCLENIFLFRGMHRFLPTLVRINGYSSIFEMGVHHRPRLKGTSKYGISNRLWVGLADAFAVRWIKARKVSPEVLSSTIERNH
jgi:dolichol-phosphate mannosyltransferase